MFMLKRIVGWALVIAMTAAIAVGGTMAYLTDTDEDVNVMTLGNVKIDQLEYERVDTETKDEAADVQKFHDNKPLFPAVTEDGFDYTPGDSLVDWGQIGKDGYTSEIWDPEKITNEVDKMVFVKNKGTYDAYVRTWFAFEAGNYTTLEAFRKMVHLNLNTNEEAVEWSWILEPVTIGESTYFVAAATYLDVLKPGQLTEISLSQIALDGSATNEDVLAFGDTYQALVYTQAIQNEGFANAGEALDDGFGKVIPENIPWENDSSIRGIDLRTALHHLNGNTANVITAKVTNIIFAKNSEYPDIIENYEGTLVDVEQDEDVYAYYVPNGNNYDVYFLADGPVYAPKNSSELCRNMFALQTVDTHNFKVDRTQSMLRMFQNCSKLVEIDTSHWNVSNVTDLGRTFQACTILPYLDVSNWDTSNVTNLYCTFGGSEKINGLEVGGWDTSKVTNMEYTFWHCYSLEYLDLADWDVGNVTHFTDLFAGRQNMGNMKLVPEVENWDMSSAVSIRDMFYGCAKIEHLDLSKWDVRNLKDMRHTFADCFGLKSVDFTGWDTPCLENLDGTFNDCVSLQKLDMSMFTTDNVYTMCQMFEGCASLKTIEGMDRWNTANVTDMSEMFNSNSRGMSLEYVDFSTFDTSKLKVTFSMFAGCGQLHTVYVGDGWDLSGVTSSGGMFSGCGKLVGGNGTTTAGKATDKTFACVDTPETPGFLTYKEN